MRRAAAGLCLSLLLLAAGCAGAAPRAAGTHQNSASSASSSSSATAPPTPSPFAIRGVIEGYYGYSWSLTATEHLLAFMGRAGMNTFVYAPKFDPYERAKWQTPYPAAQLAQLATMVKAAQAAGVNFVYSLSPGLSINYSSTADRTALEAKLAQLRGIGINGFMLSFDDIGAPATAALAQGQVAMTNAVWAAERQADPQFSLMFTPTSYYGTSSNAYLQVLPGLNAGIQVAWTGPEVLPVEVTLAQAQAFGAIVGRKPLLWLNYPVNDWQVPAAELGTKTAQPRLLFMGPLQGMAPNLGQGLSGILANPMLEPYASEIPLASIAAYLRNPQSAVTEQQAWQQQISREGGSATAALQVFISGEEAEPANGPDGYTTTSTDVSADQLTNNLMSAFATEGAKAVQGTYGTELSALFQSWIKAAPLLTATHLGQPDLAAEIAPWVQQMVPDGQEGLAALALLANPSDTSARITVDQGISRLSNPNAAVDFGGNLLGLLKDAAAAP